MAAESSTLKKRSLLYVVKRRFIVLEFLLSRKENRGDKNRTKVDPNNQRLLRFPAGIFMNFPIRHGHQKSPIQLTINDHDPKEKK